ncbi:MAG: tetratricopeptide repeat protein, partial [Myxococcota bacterium]
MAERAMEEGRWDEAASFLEEVLRSHPTNILALNRLGETCICGGDFSRALDIYLRVGEVHEETGALRKAVIAYRLALRIFPRNGDVATRLAGALVKLGHSEEASGYFRLALSIFDEHGR